MRARRLLLAMVGVATALAAAGCDTEDCSEGAPTTPDAEFVGTAIAVDDAAATFAVEEVLVGTLESEVRVTYFDDTGRFLHEGRRYLVRASLDQGTLRSSVKTAESCAGGTRNADGTAIDTGVLRELSRGTIVTRVLLPVLGVAVLLVVLIRVLGRSTVATRRHSYREREKAE